MSKRRARIGLERPVRPAIPWLEHRPGRLPGGQFAARSDEHLLPCGWRRRKHKDGRPPESSRTARWRVQATCLAHKFSRSEEHTSELQSLMRISYAVFCLKKKNNTTNNLY